LKLEMGVFPVREIELGGTTEYADGKLTVDVEEVVRLAEENPQIVRASCEVAMPGESVRVPYVLDAVEPRIKVRGPGCVFPGVMGSVDTVGSGRTHRLAGMSVVASGAIPLPAKGTGASRGGFLDMIEPGARGPLSRTVNLVLLLEFEDGHGELDYHSAVQNAEMRVAKHLAETTAGLTPSEVTTYDIDDLNPELPGVVLVQGTITIAHEAHPWYAFYGQAIRSVFPFYIHPNELMDGALTARATGAIGHSPCTWEWANHPIVEELYQAHGRELNFLGVVLHRIRFETHAAKQMAANQAAKLTRRLGASGAIVTWLGAGNAFIDTMLAVQACEREGIRTVLLTYEQPGVQGIDPPFMFTVPEADAIVSTGNKNVALRTAPVNRVAGGREKLRWDFAANAPEVPAREAIQVDDLFRLFEGVDFWGYGRVLCREY
jgi:glycine reductase